MKPTKEVLERALRSAKASLAVEGMILTDAEESLVLLRANEKIAHEEFIRRAIELAKSK